MLKPEIPLDVMIGQSMIPGNPVEVIQEELIEFDFIDFTVSYKAPHTWYLELYDGAEDEQIVVILEEGTILGMGAQDEYALMENFGVRFSVKELEHLKKVVKEMEQNASK